MKYKLFLEITILFIVSLAAVLFLFAQASSNADLNQDGTVDSLDFGMLLSYWNSISKPKADINQDGIVNSVDLGIMMSQWSVRVCESIRTLSNTQADASAEIQKCIDKAPANAIVELPAGKYYLESQVRIDKKPITLRTEGKNETMPKCALENHDCAELIAAKEVYFDKTYTDYQGLLQVISSGTVIDHIIISGNKNDRINSSIGLACQFKPSPYNRGHGHNVIMYCNNCKFTNSVVKDAICAGGLLVGITHYDGSVPRKNVKVLNNTIAFNGFHNIYPMWADGLIVHDCQNCTITNNEIIDNTDVDFIFGGCPNCIVQNNRITHSESFSGGSFYAMVIQAWPSTSGNYTGAVFSNNLIDCGPKKRCGFGLHIGSDLSYTQLTQAYGGSVHDNVIRNAQKSVDIDIAHDMEVYNNAVELPATESITNCGLIKNISQYNMGTRSYNIDTSKDNSPVTYTRIDFDGCTLNFWQWEYLVSENENMKTSFTELQKYVSWCTPSNILHEGCCSAVKHYCGTKNHVSGFGPIEHSGDEVWTTCIGKDSQNVKTTLTQLKTYVGLCDISNTASNWCRTAIKRFCVSKGYESGFGPVEHYLDEAWVTCTGSQISKNVKTTFEVLSQYQTGCTFSNPVSDACNVAIKQYCVTEGYRSGFGPVEFIPTEVHVTCTF